MNKFESASILAGMSPNEEPQVSEPTNLHAITGEVVSKSEDGTVMVSMDGLVFSEDDTQYIEMDTIGGLEEGDEATILLAGENGSAMAPLVVGSPGSVDRIRETAENASQVADAAQAVAEATNQHFFSDDNGIHVTEATQEDWDVNHSGANVLINSIGQLFRDGLNNLLTLTTESGARALTIWDGLGNSASSILARFSSDGVTIYDGTASRNVVASFDSDEVSLGANSNSSTIDMCGGAFKFSIDASDPNNVTGLIKVDQNAIDDHTANTPSILIAAGTSTLGRGIEIRGTSGAQYPVSIGEYDHGSISQHVGLGSLGVKTPGIFFDGEGTVEAYSGVYVKSLTGTNFWSTVPGTVLWSGGYYMTASHTANLSHNISTCPTGIVLHFQPYTSSTVQNYYHQYCFVPKTTSFAAIHNFTLCTTGFTKVGMKALRIYDDRIVGDDANDDTGTASGITFANNYWVMTQVIAV